MLNGKDSIGIVTSYPAKNGEIASSNAVSRYSYLLSRAFPKSQNLIIFCEKDEINNIAYQPSSNMLILPTYESNSLSFASQILSKVAKFNKLKNYLIQFEFSIYGGKKIIPSFVLMLFGLRLFNKNITITLHQVTSNLNELSGHLGLAKNSFETRLLNLGLNVFYRLVGLLSNKVIVHDELLRSRLSRFIESEKIEVIPHPVGDEKVVKINPKLVYKARKDLGFKKKDIVIGVYGYRSWYKGTDWIIKTIDDLSRSDTKLNLKLLVAGGDSPTLKKTKAYKNFSAKLRKIVKKAGDVVNVTGFIAENEVWKVFAASDFIVFPYRTRMSASGAYSLTLAYKKPFLVSRHFATGSELDFSENVFDLNTFSFENKLKSLIRDTRKQKDIINSATKLNKERSWTNTAYLYWNMVKSVSINSYANVYSDKEAYQLAQN